jgi:hypothetical protein
LRPARGLVKINRSLIQVAVIALIKAMVISLIKAAIITLTNALLFLSSPDRWHPTRLPMQIMPNKEERTSVIRLKRIYNF